MKRVIDTAVADSGRPVPGCAARNISYRKAEDGFAGGKFRRKEKIHSCLRHPAKGLDNGGADIETGRKIDDPVIADDLDIIRNPDSVPFQIADDTSCQTIGVAENAVEIQLSVAQMLLQKAVDRRLGLQIAQAQARIVRAVLAALVLKALATAIRR